MGSHIIKPGSFVLAKGDETTNGLSANITFQSRLAYFSFVLLAKAEWIKIDCVTLSASEISFHVLCSPAVVGGQTIAVWVVFL